MAVTTTELFKRYDCNGSNQNFPITFDYADDSANVVVELYDSSLGTYATLTEATDYTVSNDTVVTTSTYAAKYDILLRLDPELTQLTDWVENDQFTAASWENAVDKLTLIVQNLREQVDRCIKGPPVDVAGMTWELEGAIDRADGVLSFNASGQMYMGVGNTSAATVTAFAETFLDDVSADAVLTTLGFSSFVEAIKGLDDGPAIYEALDSILLVSNANYTVSTADGYTGIVVTAGASNRTITLPARSSNAGRRMFIRKNDSGVGYASIVPDGTDTINSTSLWDITKQYGYLRIEETGVEWAVIGAEGSIYRLSNSSDITQTLPTSGTWYNIGTLQLSLGIGVYNLRAAAHLLAQASNAGFYLGFGLSTSASSVSDKEMVQSSGDGLATVIHQAMSHSYEIRKRETVAAATTYYLIERGIATSLTSITVEGATTRTTVIEAERIG